MPAAGPSSQAELALHLDRQLAGRGDDQGERRAGGGRSAGASPSSVSARQRPKATVLPEPVREETSRSRPRWPGLQDGRLHRGRLGVASRGEGGLQGGVGGELGEGHGGVLAGAARPAPRRAPGRPAGLTRPGPAAPCATVTHDPYASLRFPEYRAFLAGMAAIFVATQIQSAVLGWQVYELTGDPLALGLVGLAEAVPFLALTLVGGWAADRMDRRALALASLAAVASSGLLLLLLSLGAPSSALPFYGAQALAGLGRAFFRPTSAALGTELVPREHYQNAATWRSSLFHTAMVLGPALGGALIALGGAAGGLRGGGGPLGARPPAPPGGQRPRPRPAAAAGGLLEAGSPTASASSSPSRCCSARSASTSSPSSSAAPPRSCPIFAKDVLQRRRGRVRLPARRPGRRLDPGGARPGPLRPVPPRRPGAPLVRGLVRPDLDRLRLLRLLPALLAPAGGGRRARRRLGHPARHAGAALDAAGEDGAGGGGQQLLHRLLQRAGGLRERRWRRGCSGWSPRWSSAAP